MATTVHLRTQLSSVHEELSLLSALKETSELAAQQPCSFWSDINQPVAPATQWDTASKVLESSTTVSMHTLGSKPCLSSQVAAEPKHLPHTPPHGTDTAQPHGHPASTLTKNISPVPSTPGRSVEPLCSPSQCGGSDAQSEQRCRAGHSSAWL